MSAERAHAHAQAKGRAFAIGMLINAAFVVVEIVYGLHARSMALLSDAGHNLGDVLGLGLAWVAGILATLPPSKRRTYGMRKATLLSALANATILVAATGAIAWESILRLMHPSDVNSKVVMLIAALGVLVNGGSALLFLRDRHADLNVKSAFVHLAGDAAIALGVVLAGAIILFTGIVSIDPITSIIVSVLVLFTAWRLFAGSLNLVVDAVPPSIDIDAVRTYLSSVSGVSEVHDLHIWSMSTTEIALTAHLVMSAQPKGDALLHDVAAKLRENFDIVHATIQLEVGGAQPCGLARDDRV